jgi:hypothetical protein
VYSTVQQLSRGYEPGNQQAVYSNKTVINLGGYQQCCCSGCGVFHRIRLRSTPVRRVIDVQVGGRSLKPDEYVILDHSILGFLTPDACCAECIVVTYLYGSIPPGGEQAAIKLANELIAAGDGMDCALPQRVTSVSRQGVSWTLLDPQDFLNDRRTGIYEIDLMLAALNPVKALMRPRVFSPDLPRAETWTSTPPPPAALLSDGDQAVILGADSTWILDIAGIRSLVTSECYLSTLVKDTVTQRVWTPVENSPTAVMTVLRPDETYTVSSGDSWAVYDRNGDLIADGKIKVL